MPTITRENFTQAMRQAVAERGADWTYPNPSEQSRAEGWYSPFGSTICRYGLPDGTPACLIGYAINLVDPTQFAQIADSAGGADEIFAELDVSDYGLGVAANAAQSLQDEQGTWGAALEAFESALLHNGEEYPAWDDYYAD